MYQEDKFLWYIQFEGVMRFTEQPETLPFHIEIDHQNIIGWNDFTLISTIRNWCQDNIGECGVDWVMSINACRKLYEPAYMAIFFKEEIDAILFKLVFAENCL